MIHSLDIRYTLKFTLVGLGISQKTQVSDDLNVLVLGYLYCNEYLLYTRAAFDTRIDKKMKKVLKAE